MQPQPVHRIRLNMISRQDPRLSMEVFSLFLSTIIATLVETKLLKQWTVSESWLTEGFPSLKLEVILSENILISQEFKSASMHLAQQSRSSRKRAARVISIDFTK